MYKYCTIIGEIEIYPSSAWKNKSDLKKIPISANLIEGLRKVEEFN